MTKEPRVNLDRLVSQITLDCSLVRWFAYNHCRDDVMAAIMFQQTKARNTEDQVLDFLVRHLRRPAITSRWPAITSGP